MEKDSAATGDEGAEKGSCRGLPSKPSDGRLTIAVNGERFPLKPFLADMIRGALVGIMKPLRGYNEGDEVVIEFK